MKVKKFMAKSMPEAMQLIKKELGPNAVILQSKEVKKGGILGLFKNKRFEVIAALDQVQAPAKQPINIVSEKEKPLLKHVSSSSNDEVLGEIKYLKQLLQEQAFTSEKQFPPLYELTYQYLLQQEVDKTIAEDIIQSALSSTKEVANKEEMKQLLHAVLMDKLDVVSFETPQFTRQIIQFVGPTGVGKTTTLAKVAAQSILQHKKNIAFITMDTYRIAAIEQLKTYARILDVPLEVAYSMEDYHKALKKFTSYDLIFVDTAGRNFRDPQYVHELKHMIEIEKMNVETYLVLSLTSKPKDIMDIYQQFEGLDVEKVIFTKVDETVTYGSILNICLGEEIPVLYFTNGQNVPDDLLEPNKELVSRLLLSRYHDE